MHVNSIKTQFKKGSPPPSHSLGCKCFRCDINAIRNTNKGKKVNYPKDRKYDYSRTYLINDNGCWLTKNKLKSHGYAANYRNIYEKTKGKIPEGLILDHLCRNHACVNPNHLEPVTYAENARRGNQAKLRKDQVLYIKTLKGQMTTERIASLFGINQSQVSRIMTGKRWGGLTYATN